jgi:spectinomycin phosphotransferase
MLQKPALPDDQLIACLSAEYGIQTAELRFLPLGADPDTAVFRLAAAGGAEYFVKLRRRSAFDEVTALVPHLLGREDRTQVIAPHAANGDRLHVPCGEFALILYPFVVGCDGFAQELIPDQWCSLGSALRRLHATELLHALAQRIPRETFRPLWRDEVRRVLHSLAATEESGRPWPAADSVAQAVAELLRHNLHAVRELLAGAEELAAQVVRRDLPFVLCHGDIHVGNVLLSEDGALYVVDWDTVILAPKERDLMFVGGGIGAAPEGAQVAHFFRGYGACTVDPEALAYYRCERVVEDIAVYCRELLWKTEPSPDRAEQLHQLAGQFAPQNVVAIALETLNHSSRRLSS